MNSTAGKCLSLGLSAMILFSCKEKAPDPHIKTLEPATAVSLSKSIAAKVSAQLDSGLTLQLWGIDSIVADPVSLDIDDLGRVYYTRTNRQKHSEFDIRSHPDWEIGSIQLSTVEEKRAFLRKTLSPENSPKNGWLADLNGDGSHDWRDMKVEKEHIYRLEDRNDDGVADQSQLVVEDFNDETTDAAGGIMKQGNDLFVGIGPDLWKIKEGKNGIAQTKTSLSHGYGIHIGFSGHGMSGIEMGPDGRIYWQIGDIGFNGTGPEGQKHEYPNSGVIVRANPDGSDFEVFAYGNRNTHEFVFDEYGNMISEDNDGDHPGESERLVYIVNGADIGWRTNWQFGKYRDPDNNTYKVWMDEKMYVPRFEGQPAYIIPTIKNFVNGPTGMLYNPGTALGEEYKNKFFIAEFVGNPTRSGIHAFSLKPKGAYFDFDRSKMILSGILATGMDFGPDGALYFGDWIDGWGTKDYGRIWKMDVKHPDAEKRKNTEQLLKTDLSTLPIDRLSNLLQHEDMRVRQKAQFELVSRGTKGLEAFRAVLSGNTHQLSRIHSIWGISQFARQKIEYASLLVPYLDDNDPEIRAQAARWIGDVLYSAAGPQLITLLKDAYPRARFFAAEALGRIAYEPAIPSLIGLLEQNNDEDHYIRHAGSLALARIGKVEPVVALAQHPSRAVRIAAVVALRRMKATGIKNFLNDTDEFIVTEAARAINDDLSIPGALPELAASLNVRKFSNEAFVRRAINANLRIGTTEGIINLLRYSQEQNAPTPLRAEALDALSTWPQPSVLDRVDGRYRGVIKRDPGPAKTSSASVLIQLLDDKNGIIRAHSAKACGKLGIDEAVTALLSHLKNDRNADVRSEAVKALSQLSTAPFDKAIQLALEDEEKSVRVSGLELIEQLPIDKKLMTGLLNNVIQRGTLEEKQAALVTLSHLPAAVTEKTLEQLLTAVEKKQLSRDILLELGEAIDSTHAATLLQKWNHYLLSTGTDSLRALYSGALTGGNPQKGASLFWGHPTAQCLRCHSFNDYGGTAGPRLNGVASRLSREQLLEALIDPSARIAPGYGVVTLELKNSKNITGILQKESPTVYILKIGDAPDTTISRKDVAKRIDAPSSMPLMRSVLTKKEIRDLISYLETLKK